jgi:hypothetical protein
MPSVQVRPEINALTKPQSYSLRFVPKVGYDELASSRLVDVLMMEVA